MNCAEQLERIARGVEAALDAMASHSPKSKRAIEKLQRAVTSDIRKVAGRVAVYEDRFETEDAVLIEQAVRSI